MVPCFDCKDGYAKNGDHKYSGTGSTLRMVELEADPTIYRNGFLEWHLPLITITVMLETAISRTVLQ
eukprot:2525703-Ditylum_brightwellii.AAC.1